MSNNEQIIMEEAAGRKTPAEKIDALLREAMAYEGSWPELRRLRLIQRLADALRRHYDEEADECPECRIDNREMEILRLSESLDVHKKMLAKLRMVRCDICGNIRICRRIKNDIGDFFQVCRTCSKDVRWEEK